MELGWVWAFLKAYEEGIKLELYLLFLEAE